MTQANHCPNCGKTMTPGAPGCPSCLIALALPEEKPSSDQPTAAHSGLFYAPRPEDIAELFPQLEIVELLGHGGMGAVYRARQINLDRLVALKLLSPRLNDDPSFAERFTREARTLAKLNHPNIVTVYDFGQAGELNYLIMELVDGINLRDAIANRTIAPKDALAIVPRICEALQYAHDEGVIHRDIKPENILLGKKDQVKIADFGLAKLLEPSQKEFTLTGTQQVLGTRNYMAPEQIEKPTQVDHRADIYSLGVVFYELLTGELPLGRFSLPSEKARVTAQLDDVVMRTLEKEPSRRYQQASQMKTAVESIDDLEVQEEPVKSPLTPPPVVQTNSHRVTVPFKITDVHGGFSESLGIAHFDGEMLDLEYETTTFSISKSGPETVSIPASEIVNARYHEGVFSDSIEVQTAHLDSAADVPNANQGRFKLVIKKSDSEMGEEFVAMVNACATGQPLPRRHGQPRKAPPAGPVGNSLAYLPFKITGVHGGFSEAFGIANIIGEDVIIDYEVKDGFGISKSAAKNVTIPIGEMISIHHFEGMMGDRLDIQMSRLDAVSKVPASTQGRIRFHIKKADRDLAESFVEQIYRINDRLATQSSSRKGTPLSDAQMIARAERKLNLPVAGLKIVAAANALSVLLALAVQLVWSAGVLNGDAINEVARIMQDRDWTTKDVIEDIRAVGNRLSGPAIAISWAVQTLVFSVLFWFAAVRMRKRRNYHLVFAAAIVAVLPIHTGFFVGIPFGIIAIIVLCQPVVKNSFDRYPVPRSAQPPGKPGELPTGNSGVSQSGETATLIRAALLFFGLFASVAVAAVVIWMAVAFAPPPENSPADKSSPDVLPAPEVQERPDEDGKSDQSTDEDSGND